MPANSFAPVEEDRWMETLRKKGIPEWALAEMLGSWLRGKQPLPTLGMTQQQRPLVPNGIGLLQSPRPIVPNGIGLFQGDSFPSIPARVYGRIKIPE